jgi:hypothetical protein
MYNLIAVFKFDGIAFNIEDEILYKENSLLAVNKRKIEKPAIVPIPIKQLIQRDILSRFYNIYIYILI